MIKKKPDIINYEAVIAEIESEIVAITQNSQLYKEKSFDARVNAIDFIDFHIIDQLEQLLPQAAKFHRLIELKHRAEKIKLELETIDFTLFQKLQADIRNRAYTSEEFRSLIGEHVDFNLEDKDHQEEPGYDNLDIFINGLFPLQTMPEQTKVLEPEMVYYQKTPARIIFELTEQLHFSKDDVLFDLGSGLGQVTMLVNMLSGIKVKGIELEPAFCRYATDCAANLNLPNVEFINVDARKADYTEGTLFFMYTPFNGKIMQDVLEILRKESLSRKIKIITYGPCTAEIALQSWLRPVGTVENNIYKLSVFESLYQ